MHHSVHFYGSRPLLAEWLYRGVRGGMEAGDTCIVIARPDIRESLERLLDLDFDVTASAAWGLYAYVYADDLIVHITGDGAGIDVGAFTEWLAGVVAEARAAGRQVAVWTEIGDELVHQGDDGATHKLEQLWETAPAGMRSVTCLYQTPTARDGNRKSVIRRAHGLADSGRND